MKQKETGLPELMALTVFALFALCLLLVLLSGAGVYRRVADRGAENHARRTAMAYVAERVRQGEGVSLEDFGGCQALVLAEETPEGIFLTRVYGYEGFLWELYSREDARLSPADGEQLLEVKDLSFSLEEDVLTAWVDGRELVLQLPGRRGILP